VIEQPDLVISVLVEHAVVPVPLQEMTTSVTVAVAHSSVLVAVTPAVESATWQPRICEHAGGSTCDETVCTAPSIVDTTYDVVAEQIEAVLD
jgi:alpha-D-ribose 1-methylphosphonate 5-triphosphate synthase subunit PhnH